MEDPRNLPPERRSRRFARAGLVVAIIVVLTIVGVFVGRNIWHARVMDQEQHTGVANDA
ncbi:MULTISPECIES: hypothetical protein [unclassified Novosphingobium]|uniref:hypothetical protein n=1 Tax=Novosphingobium TaxID=165696 RepID=UPI0014471479|nr:MULTISPECIES: hypothetical protein [unclassified Novosphingobium]NKJ42792.1 hypothetical protein [Novosphingobium sp. SG720]NMN05572.1 hypothetical protein [Novosphingobium sp. SG919]NMN88069.1 hypothetical protein [Novosphingobium sp. SG916]